MAKTTKQRTPDTQKKKQPSKVNRCFHSIVFMNGLPGTGKTSKLLAIAKKDHYRDLCINLINRHQRIQGIKYTPGFFKARNLKPIHALHIPKLSPYIDYKLIKLFHYEHPDHVQHILIDEVEKCPVGYVKRLCMMIRHFYPKVPFIIAGVVLDDHNRTFKTSKYMLKHCRSWNVNSICHFCHRPAQYMLNVNKQHHKVLMSDVDKIKDKKKRKKYKKSLTRYHVCRHHYKHPPLKKI